MHTFVCTHVEKKSIENVLFDSAVLPGIQYIIYIYIDIYIYIYTCIYVSIGSEGHITDALEENCRKNREPALH